MNKRLRVEFAGAIYHIIQRGNNKEYVFNRSQDKWFFLTSLEKVMRFCKAETLAYVIMGNHYHLLVRTGEIGLGQVMHRLNTRYSMYYNQNKQRSGHVFQGRYQADLIGDERHLLSVLRYVHQNPVQAGICSRTEDYRWSSDSFYRYLQPGFVSKDLILDLLATNKKNARFEYVRLMENVSEAEVSGNLEMTPWIPEMKTIPPISPETTANQIKPLDEILLAAARNPEAFQLIKTGSRKRDLTTLKSIYIEMAVQEGHPLQNIADNINISISAASKLKKTQITQAPDA